MVDCELSVAEMQARSHTGYFDKRTANCTHVAFAMLHGAGFGFLKCGRKVEPVLATCCKLTRVNFCQLDVEQQAIAPLCTLCRV